MGSRPSIKALRNRRHRSARYGWMPEKGRDAGLSRNSQQPGHRQRPHHSHHRAHVDEETKINALRAGASDFLPKPFSTTELHVPREEPHRVLRFSAQAHAPEQHSRIDHRALKNTENPIVQTEKLASLGRLSAGIIHESTTR